MPNDATPVNYPQTETESRCLIAYGGNQGDPELTLAAAVERVSRMPSTRLLKESSVFETTPVGSNAGDGFLNGALLIATELPPDALLHELQQIENELGRVRTVHWGPRTVDLDIVTYGDVLMRTSRLTLPHPAAWYRRFVLDPVVEIAPQAIHPGFQETFEELRQRVMTRPLRIGFSQDAALENRARQLRSEILRRFSESKVVFCPLKDGADELFEFFIRFENQAYGGNVPESFERLLMLAADPADALTQLTDILTAALGPDA